MAERRPTVREDDLLAVERYIRQGTLVVAPSFEVLVELLTSPDIDEQARIKNAQFYDSVVDWRYVLKPSDQMLRDDVTSLINHGGPSTPYYPLDADRSGFIRSIREGKSLLPQVVWIQTLARTKEQNERFVDKVFRCFARKLPEAAIDKLRAAPQETWDSWWYDDGLADVLATSFVNANERPARSSLLVLPSVRMAVGYILDTWYHQLVSGRHVRPTQHCDFRNAVLAGGVGRMVTHDRRFRGAVERIPGQAARTWTLGKLVQTMQ